MLNIKILKNKQKCKDSGDKVSKFNVIKFQSIASVRGYNKWGTWHKNSAKKENNSYNL